VTGQNIDLPCSGDASGWVPNVSTCTAWTGYTPDVQDYALQLATYVLWAATGRRLGLCSIQVRPVVPRTLPTYITYPAEFDGYSGGGFAWTLMATTGGTQLVNFADGCLGSPPQIRLPGPVNAITSVTVDAVTLPSSAYRLDGDLLVRVDGNGWPVSQDLSLALGSANTWSITYVRGEPVPAVVNSAAGLYACQVAKARTGGTCVLPNRVKSITRQGVSVETISINDVLDKGLTGVSDVDLVITMMNPGHLRARPRVLSPDLPGFR
jgi:hypothetical protein